ncbi:MAG: tRNA (guanosine(37)-N1)-methyltransferase TrmD [Oligoflexia bacterium]|nr:tRNA (guanosine(37)-N1)-methyltransferase TrmD [Oligoflexia bacterium]
MSDLRFSVLTLFPELFGPVLQSSLVGKAVEKGLVSFELIQIRDFATDKHRTVDDTPYGGGEGMLLKPDVLYRAWEKAGGKRPAPEKTATILLSPQGEHFTQATARELSTYEHLILVCGHYEGVDERFIELCVDREVSIGDYVLTGGELPALVLIDGITRLVPGVVGNEQSVARDSLEDDLLKYPQYTRPREFQGLGVPEILLSGDHGAIARWRLAESRARTSRKRPDLFKRRG